MDTLMGISFTRPAALLLLLLLVPTTVYLSRTSLALLRRRTRRLSLGLRIVVVILLVLALSGLEVVRTTDRLSVVFLLDRSDSVSAAQKDLEGQYVREAISRLGQNDQAGVIEFGADALVDRPVLADKTPPDLASNPTTTYSNLADAIRLGLAVAPADSARRLVLLSDGRQNAGDAEWAARLASASGASIDVVPLRSDSGPEVLVESLDAPKTVRENESVALNIALKSTTETTATLAIFYDGIRVTSQEVKLVRGSNNFVQQLPPAAKGFHTYTAQVSAPSGADTRPENNRYTTYSLVLGKPRVLLVEGKVGEGTALKSALSSSLDVEAISPDAMPSDVQGLAGFESVILVNVPATDLTRTGMENLQRAVRDLGKGLVVIGGDESYAAGGYFRTPLEAMLPVDLNLPSKLNIPSVAMALVIDRSGSMEMAHSVTGGSVTKIELAKEAAYRAVAQLSARDYVGVITFDSQANWVVEMQPLGDPTQFKGRIGGITSGGGTNIYSGLAPAVDALIQSKAKSKHIVLLTDGVSEGGDYDGLLKKMAANSITISTVAIGTDADTAFLQSLAQRGQGRYYYTEEGNTLPEIFAHESHLAARSYIIEHPFTPERTAPSPILAGLGGLPTLQGYVGTSPKPDGQVTLVSDAGDPILAQWQYGLGRVVAWTSDAKGQWAKDWVTWQDFARFWAQTVRWSSGSEAGGALQPRVELDAGVAHVTVDATAPDGAYANGLAVSATVIAPDLVSSTVQLQQSAAGRYEGKFPATQEGAYLVRVGASGASIGKSSQTIGLAVPYSPEYNSLEGANDLLPRLASISDGRVLTLGDVGSIYEHNLAGVQSRNDLWPLVLLLAILLLPFDIGLRRVSIYRADIVRTLGALRGRLRLATSPRPALQGVHSADMAALFGAKQRTFEQTHVAPQAMPALEPDDRPAAASLHSENAAARNLQLSGRSGRAPGNGEAAPPTTVSPPRSTPGAASEDSSLAAKLRRAREERR